MNLEHAVLLRSVVALLIAAAGALTAILVRKLSHRALCSLISLAAGALLSVTVFDIIPEAHMLVGPIEIVIGLASGYFLFFLVSKYVYHICPACAATHTEEHFLTVNILMISAVSLHSTMDGISVAASYMTGNESTSLVILLAVSFHKFPEGLALASVARAAGYRRGKAFLVALAVEATTLLGAVLTLAFLKNVSLFWFGILMAHIGGGFIYLTVHAMLGEMVKHERKSIIAYAVVGFVCILLVTVGVTKLFV